MKVCRHVEGCKPFVNRYGNAFPAVDMHDCGYVEARNALIPAADAEARRHPKVLAAEGPAREQEFARQFFAAMERLAARAGLGGRGAVLS